MKKDLSRVEFLLMKYALFKSSGLFVADITSKFGVPIRDVAAAFSTLRSYGFLTAKGSVLSLTKKGRNWIMENQDKFTFEGQKNWRQVPDVYKGSTLSAFKPYAPRKSRLSKGHFGIGRK